MISICVAEQDTKEWKMSLIMMNSEFKKIDLAWTTNCSLSKVFFVI